MTQTNTSTTTTKGVVTPQRLQYLRHLQNHQYELNNQHLQYENSGRSTYGTLDTALKDVQARITRQLDLIETDLDAFEAGLMTGGESQAEAASA